MINFKIFRFYGSLFFLVLMLFLFIRDGKEILNPVFIGLSMIFLLNVIIEILYKNKKVK